MPQKSSSLSRLFRRLQRQGISWLLPALRERTFPARPTFAHDLRSRLQGKHLLEIGGPSRIFTKRGALPAYTLASRIDNVNFNSETAWESKLCEGAPFHPDPKASPGVQFIREAGFLSGLADQSYDGVISSHCLEHLADPLSALCEWHRICKVGAPLLLVLPDPRRTFDHRRPVSSLEHLLNDRQCHRAESDSSHFEEILRLHDLKRDPGVTNEEELKARVLDNARQRCVHHHVFDLTLTQACLEQSGWQILACEALPALHLCAWAIKLSNQSGTGESEACHIPSRRA